MKTHLLLILVFWAMYNGIHAKTQRPDSITLVSHTTEYYVASSQISVITYKFTNNGNQKVWLWFENDNIKNLSDYEKIRKYFIFKKSNEDVSFYQMGMDDNVESFVPNLCGSFVKRILPKSFFSIQIISQKKINSKLRQKIDNYIENNIITYKESVIVSVIPTIDKMFDDVFYKENFIVMYLYMLKL